MKTQNNNQETVISRISKSVFFTGAIVLTVVLISMTASAQDFWKQISSIENYGKMTSIMLDRPSETEKTDALFEIINAEVSSNLNHSTESFTFETESEEPSQIEDWMTDETFFKSAELATANEADLEIAKYAERIVNDVETEKALEVENWMTDETFFKEAELSTAHEADLEVAKYAERIVNDVETEKALEVENWMTDETFFKSAELSTANEADLEVAKYAERIVNDVETEKALEVENWMTDETFFKAAELYTQNGTEKEIEKFAQKQIDLITISAR